MMLSLANYVEQQKYDVHMSKLKKQLTVFHDRAGLLSHSCYISLELFLTAQQSLFEGSLSCLDNGSPVLASRRSKPVPFSIASLLSLLRQ